MTCRTCKWVTVEETNYDKVPVWIWKCARHCGEYQERDRSYGASKAPKACMDHYKEAMK